MVAIIDYMTPKLYSRINETNSKYKGEPTIFRRVRRSRCCVNMVVGVRSVDFGERSSESTRGANNKDIRHFEKYLGELVMEVN
jgi:hypothetical protein